MDEGGLPFEGLHEIRLDRLLQHDGERAGSAELLGRHGIPVVGLAHGDPPEPLAQIVQVTSHGDESHDLARRRDVEAGLPGIAVRLPPQARHDIAQRTVVHVQAASPGDRVGVEAEHVSVHEVGVDQRGEEVVRRGDRMQVAGEVEVQVLHGHDLRVAAAGSPALDPEDGTE